MNLVRLLKQQAEILREGALKGKIDIEYKDDKYDPVTQYDKLVEGNIRKGLNEIYGSDISIIGEEYPNQNNGDSLTFIIDPIDGTKAFINGSYNCCISLGVRRGDNIEEGYIVDFMRGLMYVAKEDELSVISLLGYTGEIRDYRRENNTPKKKILLGGTVSSLELNLHNKLKTEGHSAHFNSGSIALGMTLAGVGTYDAMIVTKGTNGSITDVAGGFAIMKTSPDAIIINFEGDPYNVDDGFRRGLRFYRNKQIMDEVDSIILPI